MNSFGNVFRITTFGESHGPAIGGIIDGCPPGIPLDFELISRMMERRRPGSSNQVSQRNEPDEPEFLSGISPNGLTFGTPIGFIIRNKDQRTADYNRMQHIYRPNHADYTYDARYGIRDHRGGGRASARETANWVVAGGVALSLLGLLGIKIVSNITRIGDKLIATPNDIPEIIDTIRRQGDSVGGVVECVASGLPAGIGNPVFSKLHSHIAEGLFSINGVKGVEYGDGFAAASARGSQQADSFRISLNGRIVTQTNHSGGIQGGISNGMPIIFRVAFKPTPTISIPLETISDNREPITLSAHGRHDPCIAIRGQVVVEAMMALAVTDSILQDPFWFKHFPILKSI